MAFTALAIVFAGMAAASEEMRALTLIGTHVGKFTERQFSSACHFRLAHSSAS